MNSDDSISRMEAAGTLTPRQAEELRRASDPTRIAHVAPHRPLPLRLMIGGAVALAIVLLAFFWGGTADTPNIVQDVSQTINTIEGVGAMNRGASQTISYILFGLPVVLGLLCFVWIHNGLVRSEEAVYNAWADVESTYKRRADLVPNLVNVVETYMRHEKSTLAEVTGQRNDIGEALKSLVEQQKAAAEALLAAKPEDEQGLVALDASQSALMKSMHGVMVTAEAYPDLRSADHFLALQAELEGTENRINVARMRFNEAVQQFNRDIRVLPASLVASLGHFQRKAYFTAAAEDKESVHLNMKQ